MNVNILVRVLNQLLNIKFNLVFKKKLEYYYTFEASRVCELNKGLSKHWKICRFATSQL